MALLNKQMNFGPDENVEIQVKISYNSSLRLTEIVWLHLHFNYREEIIPSNPKLIWNQTAQEYQFQITYSKRTGNELEEVTEYIVTDRAKMIVKEILEMVDGISPGSKLHLACIMSIFCLNPILL